MKSTSYYLKVWQKALRVEINHLKNIGRSKYPLINGQLMKKDEGYTYFFETPRQLNIPIGSIIVLEPISLKGRILSSEGKSVILSVDASLGTMLDDLFLVYDPWELLNELHERLEEIKDNKRKRARIKRLMNPANETKHPQKPFKSNVHELIIRSKYNPVTFVWGPPGTGKTYTLARVAANKYVKGQKILILAQSNQAVDVLMAEISHFINKKGKSREGDILRYGNQAVLEANTSITANDLLLKHAPELVAKRTHYLEERNSLKQILGQSYSKRDSEELLEIERKLAQVVEKIRQKEIQFVKDAEIVGTTLAKAATDPIIYEANYDLVIIDEVSMAYVPQIGFAATLGSRLIICGDFKQLPPIATAKHPLVDSWLREDIFHKANVIDWLEDGAKDTSPHAQLFILKEQRRMHPEISAFTNHYIYHSLVDDHESVKKSRNAIVERAPFQGMSSVLLNSSGMGNYCLREKTSHSRFNLWQLFLSFQVIHEAYLAGARSIGYVTPYRAQAEFMDTLLADIYHKELFDADIISATVHRFQGSERDVMVFDTVESNPQTRPGMLLIGRDSERLINVAITRTRGKFIHVSDHKYIQAHVYRSKTIRKLVEYQIGHKQKIDPHMIGKWIKHQHPKLLWFHAKKLDRFIDDLKKAKRSIIIGLPPNKQLTKEWESLLSQRNTSVQITYIPAENPERETLSFPFIIIDEQYLWVGMPFEASVNVTPPSIAARLHSEPLIQLFLTQLT